MKLYDLPVARDFAEARLTATIPVFQEPVPSRYYRGRRFGYVARPGQFELWAVSGFNQVMRDARACAHVSCGD
ncbi:MAG: hypothetical protein DLM50_00940 [Candidatus Meridianibacter frigidus]|nr:MAG: hypothetical protein DLM50_00940 [Candidatus Eremiobacteraeota bacterium]